MKLKLFYTPLDYKSIIKEIFSNIIKRIDTNDYSSILYIAPANVKIKETKQIFHTLINNNCYIPPQMYTLSQFANRLCEIYSDKKIISSTLSNSIISILHGKNIGSSMIISKFIETIKTNFTYNNIDNVKVRFECACNELGIPEDIKERILYSFKIFTEYQRLLSENNLIDENDALLVSESYFDKNLKLKTTIIDGFYELKNNEKGLFKKIIESSEETLIILPHSLEYNDLLHDYIEYLKNNFNIEEYYKKQESTKEELNVFAYQTIEDEIEGIAKYIKYNFISNNITDLNKIIITIPNYYKYYDTILRIFNKFGIPLTFETPKPLSKTKPYIDLLNLIESIIDDYPRITFSSFLTSPYFKKTPDILKKYIPFISLYSAIKGKNDWTNLSKLPGLKQGLSNLLNLEKDNLLEDIEKKIKWLLKIIEPLEEIKNGANLHIFSEKFMNIINVLDFHDPFNPDINTKQKLYEILNNISFIDILKDKSPNFSTITLSNFKDILKLHLDHTFFENETAGVRIVALSDCQYLSSDHLFFAGLTEEDIPYKPEIDYLLPEGIKSYMQLSDINKLLRIQRFIFEKIIGSFKKVILSYPLSEEDKILLPSPFIPWGCYKNFDIKGIFSKEEELILKGEEPLSNQLKEILIPESITLKKIFNTDNYIKVTDIDNYRLCPRRYFIEKVLNLSQLNIIEYGIEKLILGKLSHKIMETLISKRFASKEGLKNILLENVESILSDIYIDEYWKNVIISTFYNIIDEIYEIEKSIEESGYTFLMAEKKVKGEILPDIKLVGEIDRIDIKKSHSKTNENAIAIIDYKTGSYNLSGSQILTSGANLQLFLYASLMKLIGFNVDKVGIYSLKDLKITWLPNKNDLKNNKKIEDYINATLKFLKETIKDMRSGNFRALPLNEHLCKNCFEISFCPYIQKTIENNGIISRHN